MFLLVGCLSLCAAFIMWAVFGDADLTTLISHMLFGHRKQKYAGKVIWITGASSGIGEEIAYIFARINCKLILSGTRMQELERVRNKCEMLASGTQVKIICGDITLTKNHPAWIEEVIEMFGEIHVLVNNAGRSQRSDFEKIPEQIARELFDVNLFSVMSLTRLVVGRWMEKNLSDREILVTSSLAGKLGAPYSATYCASKHALHGFFESLRSELLCRGYNIRITLACPGPVRSNIRVTAYTDKVGEQYNMPDSPKQKNLMQAKRCAELMVAGLAYGLDEVWICRQPILFTYYFVQYAPSIFRLYLLRFFMNKNTARIRDGQ